MIGLDIEPGQVAYFRIENRDYAIACSEQVDSSGRARNRTGYRNLSDSRASWQGARALQTRQLALPVREEQTPPLPDGISIRLEAGVWVGYDQYAENKVIAWSADRQTVLELVSDYVAEVRRQRRLGDKREFLRNRLP
jgi:hypothetical protein